MQTLPRLKKYQKTEGEFVFPQGRTKIEVDFIENACYIQAFINVYNDYFKLAGTTLSLNDGQPLIKAKKISSDIEEYYQIDVLKDGIEIFYADKLGLRNAVATLISLAQQNKKKVYLECAKIQDYPNYSHRSILIEDSFRWKNLKCIFALWVYASTDICIGTCRTTHFLTRLNVIPKLTV